MLIRTHANAQRKGSQRPANDYSELTFENLGKQRDRKTVRERLELLWLKPTAAISDDGAHFLSVFFSRSNANGALHRRANLGGSVCLSPSGICRPASPPCAYGRIRGVVKRKLKQHRR